MLAQSLARPYVYSGPRNHAVSGRLPQGSCAGAQERPATALAPPAGCALEYSHRRRPCALCRSLSNLNIAATLPEKLRQLNALKVLRLDGNRCAEIGRTGRGEYGRGEGLQAPRA